MAVVEDASGRSRSGPGWRRTLLVSAIVLLGAAVMTALVFSTAPKAAREGATRETAMLVQVTSAERGAYHPTIVALGTVVPEKDLVLSPRVGGEVVARSPDFTPGGLVARGRTLVRIDPSDHANALAQRESELREAMADLRIEMGRQEVARQDYALLGETLTGESEGLVLREPQRNAARARVAAAEAAVERARLDLQRTTVAAPFDALVIRRNVSVGSQVSPGSDLGRLVGVETYWVEAAVPLAKLRWLAFPDGAGGEGSEVRVRDREAWAEGTFRSGQVVGRVGALDERTRMARVLVAVQDPLARGPAASGLPALTLGAFVEAHIRAAELRDVVRLHRDHLRKNDTVWVMKDGALDIRAVEIVFRDAEYAYVRDGLQEGERIVTTQLATVAPGVPLRTTEPDAAAALERRRGAEVPGRTDGARAQEPSP